MALYSEEIEVTCEGELARPVSFVWRGVEYRIQAIVSSWQDHGFPAGAPRKRGWRLRRHRNYYAVRTEDGRLFEIYLDRKGPDLAWVLYREVETPGEEDTEAQDSNSGELRASQSDMLQ